MDEQETITLSEISQAWKDRWHTDSLKCGNENTGFKEAETRAVVPRTWAEFGGGQGRETMACGYLGTSWKGRTALKSKVV